MIERSLIPAIWLCWAVYWWWAARDVKRNQWRESRASRLVHGVPLVAAFVLLSPSGVPARGGAFGAGFAGFAYWAGAASTAAGLGFAVWARRHIGRNWSGIITIKVDHELVTTGPYAIVRHPIYTGLLLGFAGSALAVGRPRGLLAFGLAAVAISCRIHLEDGAMRRRFGRAYEEYAQRVAAVIPFLR